MRKKKEKRLKKRIRSRRRRRKGWKERGDRERERGNERKFCCLYQRKQGDQWQRPKTRVHTVTEPDSLSLLPPLPVLVSTCLFPPHHIRLHLLCITSLAFFPFSVYLFQSPPPPLSSPPLKLLAKQFPKLRTCLCKSHKSRSIVRTSLYLSLLLFSHFVLEVKLCSVSGRKKICHRLFLLNFLFNLSSTCNTHSQLHKHTHTHTFPDSFAGLEGWGD